MQHFGLRVILVEDHRALGQLRHGVLEVSQRPRIVAADDLAEAHRRRDAKIKRQLIELAIDLRGVQRLLHERVARELRIGIDVRPEVFEQALGRVLPHGHEHTVGDEVGHVARDDLGGELREARVRVLAVRGVFRVVGDDNAVIGIGLVELHDLAAQIVVEAVARERQLGLLLHGGRVHAAEHHDLLLVRIAGVVIQNGDDATIRQEAERIGVHPAAVHVAREPVDDLFRLAGVLTLAEDVRIAHVVIIIYVVARVDRPRVGDKRRLLAPVLCHGVELLEHVRAVGGAGDNADLALRELAHPVDIVVGLAANEAAVRAVDVDGLIVVGVDVALVVGEDGVDGIIAEAVAALVILADVLRRDGAQERAVRVELDEFGDVLVVHAVLRVAVDLAIEPDRAVRAGGNGAHVRIAVKDLPRAVGAHGDAVRPVRILFHGFGFVVFELCAFSARQIHAEQRFAVCIVEDLCTVFIGVGFLFAGWDARGEVQRVRRDTACADPVDILRQVEILRLIGVFRRADGGTAIVFSVLLCIGRAICGGLAASGQKTQQQRRRKRQRRNPFVHKCGSPFVIPDLCHTIVLPHGSIS